MGKIGTLRILGYADDADILDKTADAMTARLTKFADKAIEQADMKVKPSKTYYTQIV